MASDGENQQNEAQVDFGVYITQEYSILKNIFSHLTAKELHVCARVCREWKKMAYKFIQFSVECYVVGANEDWPEFNRRISPSLVFYYENKCFSPGYDAFYETLKNAYDLTNVPFLSILSAHPILTPCSRGIITLNRPNKCCEVGRTLTLFPKIPGLKIRKYVFDKQRAVKPEEVEPLLSAKGVLLMSESSRSCVTTSKRIVNHLYFNKSKKNELRPERPCLVGGLVAKCCHLDNEGALSSSPVVAVTLEGDNVTIQCDINKTNDFDSFYKRLSENAGPTPPGAVRFAFIFNCVGRDDSHDDYNEELALFREYFPGVPHFGYWSYGEFCIPDSHARMATNPKKIRMDRLRFLNSASATFMIVTVQPTSVF